MRKIVSLFLFVAVATGEKGVYAAGPVVAENLPVASATQSAVAPVEVAGVQSGYFSEIYRHLGLDRLINFSVFEKAIMGYNKITAKKKEILALIDFSKPSTEQRLFVIDLKEEKMLFSTYVAHGKNSGDNYATSFSNKQGSHKSSLGFFLTANSYMSNRNGYSLQLLGLENGINDNALTRGVVVHGADYCDPAYIEGNGRLGRSFGCPAIPEDLTAPIIDTLKGGAVLFIYAPDQSYLSHSSLLKPSKS